MLGFSKRLERPYFILADTVDTGNFIASRDTSGRVLGAGEISGGDRRRSGVLRAKGFTKIVSPPYDSSTISAILGGVP